MPEEKYRTTIDHLSDRIYAYLDGYKNQGLKEGISEQIIKVIEIMKTEIMQKHLTAFINEESKQTNVAFWSHTLS